MCRLACEFYFAGIPGSIENPIGSRMWILRCMERTIRKTCAVKTSFAHCAFGARWRKATTLAHWLSYELSDITTTCSSHGGICDHSSKHHLVFEGKLCAVAAAYPKLMCRKFARLISNKLMMKSINRMDRLVSPQPTHP